MFPCGRRRRLGDAAESSLLRRREPDSLVVLLHQSGDFSIDAQRKFLRHNHHGLELDRGVGAPGLDRDNPTEFFSRLRCRIYTKPVGGANGAGAAAQRAGELPWGHFPLVYASIICPAFMVHETIADAEGRYTEVREVCVPGQDVPPLSTFVASGFDALSLLRMVPDLNRVLIDHHIEPLTCTGHAGCQHIVHPEPRTKRFADPVPYDLIWHFGIDTISEGQRQRIREWFAKNPKFTAIPVLGGKRLLYVLNEQRVSGSTDDDLGLFPDHTDDLFGRVHFVLDPESYVPEICRELVLLFMFGMLCRYYPDVWMRVIQSSVVISALLEAFSQVAMRRLPNLVLDHLTGTKHRFGGYGSPAPPA